MGHHFFMGYFAAVSSGSDISAVLLTCSLPPMTTSYLWVTP